SRPRLRARAHRGVREAEPPACDLFLARIRRDRRAGKLWHEPLGRLSPDWRLRRQDSQGPEARRSSHPAADDVRARGQSRRGAGARPHHSLLGLAARGQSAAPLTGLSLKRQSCSAICRKNLFPSARLRTLVSACHLKVTPQRSDGCQRTNGPIASAWPRLPPATACPFKRSSVTCLYR